MATFDNKRSVIPPPLKSPNSVKPRSMSPLLSTDHISPETLALSDSADVGSIIQQPLNRRGGQLVEITAAFTRSRRVIRKPKSLEHSASLSFRGAQTKSRSKLRSEFTRDVRQRATVGQLQLKHGVQPLKDENQPRTKRRRSNTLAVASEENVTESAETLSSQSDIVQGSRLLNLPGEVRNMIWRFVVVSSDPLVIVGDSPRQPDLTRTCRQTRSEALRFFYKENKFACTISNYNPNNFKRYRKVADKYGLSTVLLTHRHDPNISRAQLRTNFLSWLEGTVKGETAPLGYSAGHTEETFMWDKLSHRIVKIFNIAKKLRTFGVDWADAKEILSNAVDAAGVCGEKRR